jgi:uncharacterized protein YkwD
MAGPNRHREIFMRHLASVVVIGVFGALAACTVSVPPGPAPAQVAPVADVSGQGFDAVLNATRAAYGRSPATEHPLLTAAALGHAQDMATNGHLSHQGRDGSDHMRRIRAAGYCTGYAVENLAWDWASAERAGQEWAQSPKHLENMLLSGNVEYGLGDTGDRYVLVVARPC